MHVSVQDLKKSWVVGLNENGRQSLRGKFKILPIIPSKISTLDQHLVNFFLNLLILKNAIFREGYKYHVYRDPSPIEFLYLYSVKEGDSAW